MRQFSRFLMVGVLNTLIGYFVIFSCMYVVELGPESSNIAGYATGLIFSYLLNRNYTFKSKQGQRSEIFRFVFVFFIAYASNFGVLLILIYGFKINAGASQIIASIAYITISYLLNKHFVFKIHNGSMETK